MGGLRLRIEDDAFNDASVMPGREEPDRTPLQATEMSLEVAWAVQIGVEHRPHFGPALPN